MKISKWLLATAAFFAVATPAYADPITTALFGAVFAASIPGQILSLVITGAISYGVSLIQKASTKQEDQRDAGTSLSVQMGDDQPVSFIGGSSATAGKRKYIGTWGSVDKTPNAYLVDVIELGSLPASGLEGVWVGDDKVNLILDQPHPDGRGYPVLEYRREGTDYLWIKFQNGTQTVADPYLRAQFGSDVDRPFLATMIGRGCPYAVVTMRHNRDLFVGGAPTCLFELGSVLFYDVRKDSTNGGSGTHRWNNPATWAPSKNNAVIIYNIIRGMYYGDEWVYGGQNLAAFRLPSSNWIAAANECDAAIALSLGGTEPAFRTGYEFRGDERPIEAIDKLRKACNGRLAEVGGIFKILVGAPGAAIYAFTDDDIIVTEGQNYSPFPTLADTVNGIEATYPEPAEKWATKDAPARYSDLLEEEDGNNRLATGLTFEAAPYGNQVQRLMLAAIQDARRFRTHQFYLPPDAYALEPNDVVAWTSARNGYENKKFLVISVVGARTFNQLVMLKEIDPADYDWDSDFELPTSTGWVGTITPPAQPMYGWQVEPATLNDGDGVPWRPSIRISCAPGQDDVRSIWVKVRLKATSEIVFDSQQTAYAAPYSWVLNANFKASTEYEAQGRFIPYSNRPTEWSDWLSVTTPNVSTDDLIADLAHIGQDVRAVFTGLYEMLGRQETLLEQIQQNLQITGGVSQSIGRKLSIQGATFNEQIVVLSSDIASVVAQTTEIAAQLNETTANGLVSFQAVAAPAGVDIRYAILLKGEIGDAWKQSGFFVELYTQGGVLKSRAAFDVDQLVISSGTNKTLPFVFDTVAGVFKLQNLKVSSLDALSATLGNVDISNANIGNLVVGTSNIQSGVITRVDSVQNSGTAPTEASVTCPHGTGPCRLEVIFGTVWNQNSGSPGGTLTFYDDTAGTPLFSFGVGTGLTTPASACVSYPFIFTPPAGRASTTFRIRCTGNGSHQQTITVKVIKG